MYGLYLVPSSWYGHLDSVSFLASCIVQWSADSILLLFYGEALHPAI